MREGNVEISAGSFTGQKSDHFCGQTSWELVTALSYNQHANLHHSQVLSLSLSLSLAEIINIFHTTLNLDLTFNLKCKVSKQGTKVYSCEIIVLLDNVVS